MDQKRNSDFKKFEKYMFYYTKLMFCCIKHMCGIWLFLTKNDLSPITGQAFESFMKIKHRGPDNSDFKILNDFKTIIGFHRLSINGLNKHSANQPFVYDTDDTLTFVICNGEIYNYKELAETYSIELTTGSDCEILYPLYKKIGMHRLMNEVDAECAMIFCELNKKTNEVRLIVGRDQLGIRSLFMSQNKNEICFASELKGIPESHLKNEDFKVRQFPPRNFLEISSLDDFSDLKFQEYFDYEKIPVTVFDREKAHELIRKSLYEAVESRMMSDREFGCLLSGGLDSSLVSAIASSICKKRGNVLKTFCIGVSEKSPDVINAKIVANHIGSKHTTIIVSEAEALEYAKRQTTYNVESSDCTTNRATTFQLLVSKWISEHTNIKVLLIGDTFDELCSGYIYTLKAPNLEMFHKEVLKLLTNIHYFDVKRSDNGISAYGIECRCPCKKFTFPYLSISSELRMPKNGTEKDLLREAFKNTGLLPETIRTRSKNAFSDAVSVLERSWYVMLQEDVEKMYTDDEFEKISNKYTHMKPMTKESLFYRQMFEKHFGKRQEIAKTIPYYWLPNPEFIGYIEYNPSARVLKELYKE